VGVPMSGIRKNIWEYLKDRVFRQTYVEEHVRAGVAHQIKAMREARGWSQAVLAERCGKSQSNIARIEDPDYGKFSVQTLLEIAHTFDVWLSLEFVSFGKGLARTANRSVKALDAISFGDELALVANYPNFKQLMNDQSKPYPQGAKSDGSHQTAVNPQNAFAPQQTGLMTSIQKPANRGILH